MKRVKSWLGLIMTGCLGISAYGLTVQVDRTGGAPCLKVDGVPVRARMFFGMPGAAPMPAGPAWREVAFQFVASASATNGTLHFRFGHAPGEVLLQDLRLTDLDDGRELIRSDFRGGPDSFKKDWTFWPAGAQNTVGTVQAVAGAGQDGAAALQVKLQAPPQGSWPDFHVYHHARLNLIQGHRYRASFRVRSTTERNLAVALYQPGAVFRRLGGPPDVFPAQIKLAANAGVNFVSFPVGLPWPKPGAAADWSPADDACETVLRANPQALLLPRIGMDPPRWWAEAHPGEVMQWEDGHRSHAVPASPLFRRDAAERLAALVAHLEEKFGARIAGYHPCGQNTGEWFYEDSWKTPLNGYAPADLAAWRQWLAQRYGSDAALQRAWQNPAAMAAAAAVPSPALRHAAPAGILRDPSAECALWDWSQFQQEAMADCVLALARAVRTASQGRKLSVFFYGYVFEFGALQNGPAVSGHYALRRVLNSPDVDVLCSPISYFDRGLGQSAPAMTAVESVALAGKLWLNEDDTHTYLATQDFPGYQQHAATREETNQELLRNVAQEATRHIATWWMDLGASGWFNDPAFWAEMKRLRALDDALLARLPFQPEVAAVLDERVMWGVAAGGHQVTRPGIYEARAPLGRLGAPYGQYLLDDVAAGRVAARLYVFLNAWRLAAAEREQLLRATRGAARLWCYAPGYFEDNRVSAAGMQSLTGFALKKVAPATARATPTASGRRQGLSLPLGPDKPIQPLLAAADATPEETLATYPDGSAAVALRQTADGLSLFVGPPGLTAELLRLAARRAKVHLYTETDCNVYANGPFIALHAAQDGPITLRLRQPGRLTDLLTGNSVGNGSAFTMSLKRGETRIFRED